MGLFSREKKVYFQQECKEKNDEIIKKKVLNKVLESECVITAEMLDEIISEDNINEIFDYSLYPEPMKEIAKALSVSNLELFRMLIIYVGKFEISVEVSNTTKVIIQFEEVDEEIRDSAFPDIKVIGFVYKKKSTDEEIEKISEWMLEFKALCDKIWEQNEVSQKR
ncbi:hypothetical protein COE51_10040 [Bacillus pseudomycoides]|nr:hypothetical protein COE51_10040 [Bacillus pseudomycoides]